jgi:undecaprenyl-diphosphatase
VQLWHAIVLGLVEGTTEFLPVSSTAHLLVAQRLMGIATDDASNAYAVAIQGGAIAAVLVLYWHRIVQLGRGLVGRDVAGSQLLLSILVAFVPAALVGLAFDDVIERHLFSPLPIAAAWAAGGVLMLAISSRLTPGGAPLETVSTRAAFIVGLCQCAAMWPGVSRSLATIVAGSLVGLSLTAAVEFSFLLGLVTLGAATAYKAIDSGRVMLQAYGGVELAAGFVAAWVAATLSVFWMVHWLQRRRLAVFAWWRLAAAATVIWLALSQRI